MLSHGFGSDDLVVRPDGAVCTDCHMQLVHQTGRRVDLVDWLAMEGETFEFDPEPMNLGLLDPDL